MKCFILFITFNIIGEFYKVYTEKERKEEVKGEIYYQYKKDFFYLKVNFPVNQILTRKGETLLIYYPEEKIGFKIITFKEDLPLGINFLKFNYLKGDTIFPKLGFIFVKKEKKGDTIISEWATKEKIERRYIIKKNKERIINLRIEGEGKNRMEVVFDGFYENEGVYFPKAIKIYFKNPFKEYKEEIFFENLKFVEEFPDSIENFSFPPGTKIKFEDLRWKK